eukprot:TRINITY_DN11348_c0_g1_i1.p2 TRINITY_DN11348_c0_g1~~TRINITY_DN11348_c0_g1_i1.p2  ORF type:complete len:232 (+),score=62.39 TRINITY_DN11348_c0_g1_i1:83-697(+)
MVAAEPYSTMACDPLAPPEGEERRSADISDAVVDRLIHSLDLMNADYEATLAAERRPAEVPQVGAANAEDDDDSEEDGDAPAQAGYSTLGGYAMMDSDDEAASEPKDEERPEAAGDLKAEDDDFSDFQNTPALEHFADFANVVVPPPPEQPLQWTAAPMTDGDKKLIQDVMKGIHIEPPPWAQRLSDKDLARKVKKMLKEEPQA